MNYRSESVVITADASGDATGYIGPLNGLLKYIRYVAHGSTPYTNTVDFTITSETTGAALWSATDVAASTTYSPGALISASTTQYVQIPLANDRIKIVIAQAGDSKIGTFYAITEGRD
jgi:hypothetical protein